MPPTPDLGPDGDRQLMDALFSPEGRNDPQAVMRAHETVGCRYAVVDAVLRHRATTAPQMPPSDRPMFQLLSRFMARLDGERHRQIRSRFVRIFTPGRTLAYGEVVRNRARALLDATEGRDSMDLVADFARPLPFGVISDVLGVPVADQPWLEATMTAMNAGFAGQRDPALADAGDRAVTELLDYFDAALADRAAQPRDDLLSSLALDSAAPERADLVANCVFFLLAGHATTTTLLATGAAILSEQPRQLAELRADPNRWEPAVEELLRFVSPITITGVGVPEDVVADGHRLEAGVNRLLCFAAANRDPDAFVDPDQLDLGRTPNHHLAFSVGAHHCLGAPLARLHARIGLAELFERRPTLRVDGEPIWRGAAPVRQLAALPVSW